RLVPMALTLGRGRNGAKVRKNRDCLPGRPLPARSGDPRQGEMTKKPRLFRGSQGYCHWARPAGEAGRQLAGTWKGIFSSPRPLPACPAGEAVQRLGGGAKAVPCPCYPGNCFTCRASRQGSNSAPLPHALVYHNLVWGDERRDDFFSKATRC